MIKHLLIWRQVTYLLAAGNRKVKDWNTKPAVQVVQNQNQQTKYKTTLNFLEPNLPNESTWNFGVYHQKQSLTKPKTLKKMPLGRVQTRGWNNKTWIISRTAGIQSWLEIIVKTLGLTTATFSQGCYVDLRKLMCPILHIMNFHIKAATCPDAKELSMNKFLNYIAIVDSSISMFECHW